MDGLVSNAERLVRTIKAIRLIARAIGSLLVVLTHLLWLLLKYGVLSARHGSTQVWREVRGWGTQVDANSASLSSSPSRAIQQGRDGPGSTVGGGDRAGHLRGCPPRGLPVRQVRAGAVSLGMFIYFILKYIIFPFSSLPRHFFGLYQTVFYGMRAETIKTTQS